jgi:serine/threonine protein phosphatase PrpC
MSLQPVDLALVQAYLHNVQMALINDQPQHASSLLDHALTLLGQPVAAQGSVAPHLPLHIDVGIGLDAGLKRNMQPNEDCTFAAQGVRDLAGEVQETFGLFVVADGLGGYADGQEASHLATETLVDEVFPQLRELQACEAALQALLIEGVYHANEVVYQRNQEQVSQRGDMGTTITAVVIAGSEAQIANVGDSRSYLFRLGMGLKQLTRDHSLVAQMVLDGDLHPDDIYTHSQRHVITRSLGTAPSIEVDIFSESLQDGDVLLLCSDGLWEMVRYAALARVLSSSWLSAQQMAQTLVQLALQAGGLDNIGLVVVQVHRNVEETETLALSCAEYALLAS